MARLPRLALPGYPHHVVQRGNNRQPIFLDAADREMLWNTLLDHARPQQVLIHAYVFMDSQFHLLATPQTDKGLSVLMQSVGRGYVRYFNQRHGRTGTLWDGRFRSAVLQAERWLFPCMVYLDQSPVREGMCGEPVDFRWSSHGHYTGLRSDRLITPHRLYWELGNTPFARDAAYAALVREGLSRADEIALAGSERGSWPLGDADFVQALQQATPRRVTRARPGRPALVNSSDI